ATFGADRPEAAARLGAYQYLLVARPGAAEPAAERTTDALDPSHELERVRDAEALLREKRESLGPDDVLEFTVRNVKHWSVVHPLLAHDQWSADPDQLRFFTLDELGDLLERVGLEGIGV